jgi:hypothetical protein
MSVSHNTVKNTTGTGSAISLGFLDTALVSYNRADTGTIAGAIGFIAIESSTDVQFIGNSYPGGLCIRATAAGKLITGGYATGNIGTLSITNRNTSGGCRVYDNPDASEEKVEFVASGVANVSDAVAVAANTVTAEVSGTVSGITTAWRVKNVHYAADTKGTIPQVRISASNTRKVAWFNPTAGSLTRDAGAMTITYARVT